VSDVIDPEPAGGVKPAMKASGKKIWLKLFLE
jgi:hypothetical protein